MKWGLPISFQLLMLIPLWLLSKIGQLTRFALKPFFDIFVTQNKTIFSLLQKITSLKKFVNLPIKKHFLTLSFFSKKKNKKSNNFSFKKLNISKLLTFFSVLKNYCWQLITNLLLLIKEILLMPFLPLSLLKRSTIKNKKTKKRKHAGRPRSRSVFTYLVAYRFKKQLNFLQGLVPSPIRIALFLTILLLGFIVYSFILFYIARDLPSPTRLNDLNGPLTTTFYDRNGKVLYRLYEDKNRTLVNLDDLPQDLIHATIATEDKNFYQHSGVDIQGVLRAIYSYFNHGEVQGGSTITQQLIKNTLLTPERTFNRKLKEVILAFWAERIFNKKEILQMYFNEVPFGGQTWGIASAAQTYFNKTPKELTLGEISYLAGLPASPTSYSPYGTHPELGFVRQKEVLQRMVDEHYINQSQADTAAKEELHINPPVSQIKAPHFVMYAKELLAQKYGERFVAQGGLKVYTSIDLDTQQMAEQAVADEVAKLSSLDVSNGAAMITDATTGEILAMVGSKNYWDQNGGNFNVTTAERQPGSSIKPITYATAFKQGFSPGTIMLDTPTTFKTPWESYSPVNYDGKFHGAVTIRTSLGSSYNIPAVKMLNTVGLDAMLQTAKDLGITTLTHRENYGLSLTLGAGEVKMTDMMEAYGTFSQMGVKHDLTPILKVVDAQGEVLEEANTQNIKRALDPAVSYMITDILSDNKARTPAFGPNSLLVIPGFTVAVKTGTTDNKKDNWTFGYTPKYVVGVWVGNNNNKPMNPLLTSGVTGAAPIWHRIMVSLLKGTQNLAFEKPDTIIEGQVDGRKDLIIKGQIAKSLVKKEDIPPLIDNKDAITYKDSDTVNQKQQITH
jgi:1A family penicillin-binding protein